MGFVAYTPPIPLLFIVGLPHPLATIIITDTSGWLCLSTKVVIYLPNSNLLSPIYNGASVRVVPIMALVRVVILLRYTTIYYTTKIYSLYKRLSLHYTNSMLYYN